MGWTKALNKIRRWEQLPSQQVRMWVTKFFHEQEQKQEKYFEMFVEGKLKKEEFAKLIETDDVHRHIDEKERKELTKNFDKLTEEDMLTVLACAFPKEFTLQFCIESMFEKTKDDFTPSEWNDVYGVAIRFFSRERRGHLSELLEEFWNDDVYQKYISEGHSDEELFRKFIETCSYYGVHPIYCDLEVDGYYKLLDLNHYVLLLKRRTAAIASELKSKAQEVKALQSKGIDLQLPGVNGDFRKRLESGDNIYETLKFPLPPPKESEPKTCPFEECRRKFLSEEQLRTHLIHQHKSKEKAVG